LFLIKGERKRERKKKRVNCGVLVSLQRQKFYFSEEEKPDKAPPPLVSNEQKKGKRE
jgi:hypothetical protein